MTLAFRAFFTAIFTTIKRWKIVFFLLCFNLVFAFLASLPLLSKIYWSAGRFGGLDRFIKTFDPEILLDFTNPGPAASGLSPVRLGVWGILYFILFNVLSGGIIFILADSREVTTLKTFFRACGNFCFRFMRLLFYYALLLAVLALVNGLLNGLLCWLFEDFLGYAAGSENLGWILFAKNVLMAAAAVFAVLSFEYGKIAAVIEDGHFMGYYLFRGMGFTLGHPIATGLFFLLSLVPFAAVTALYILLSRSLNPQGSYAVLEGILPEGWVVSGAVAYIALAQAAQFLLQGALVLRYAGGIHVFKRLMVLAAHPDPDLEKNIPESYFIADSPALPKGGGPAAGKSLPALVMLAALFAAAAAAPLAAAEENPLSKRVVSYDIRVRLDPERWTIEGTEHVAFTNTTAHATRELVFHLYPNAYACSGSVHQRLKETPLDFSALDESALGFMEIETVAAAPGSPALSATPSIEDTQMRVPLPSPLEPGGKTALDIAFRVKFPNRLMGRSGYIGRHLMAAQWYPKLAVLEDRGCVAPLFLPRAEFYGDFGVFDVAVTLPESFKVEGSGSKVEVVTGEEEGMKTVRFRAEDVHDFAWVADENALIPDSSTHKGVKIVNVVQPYAEDETDRIDEVLRKCLDLYGEWYMPYPYERIVVVGAPHGVPAGMEYPTLINISLPFPTHLDRLTRMTRDPAGVVVHEFTHQYFYGIVANDEADDPWLDEGLTTYSTQKAMEEIFGPGRSIHFLSRMEKTILLKVLDDGFGVFAPEGSGPLADLLRKVNVTSLAGYDQSPFHGKGRPTLLGYRIGRLDIPGFNTKKDLRLWMKKEYVPVAGLSPVTARAGDFYPGSYHPIVYSKTALCLETLENHIGRTKMRALLKTYVERFRFKHPHTEDFLSVVLEVAGPKYKDMVDQLLRGTGTVDFSVDRVTCRPAAKPAGYRIQKAPGEPVELPLPDEGGIENTAEGERAAAAAGPAAEGPGPAAGKGTAGSRGFEWEVIVTNRGSARLDAEVELLFQGGRTERRVFEGKRPFMRIAGRSPDRLIGAAIDPDAKFACDLNRINNSRTAEFQEDGVLFLTGVTHFWIENFLNGWAFFN